MIQPISRLPWKEKLSKSGKKYQILDFNNNIIIDDVKHLADAMYIEKAINNYPRAIELLKRIWNDGDLYWEDASGISNELDEFLNQIENG